MAIGFATENNGKVVVYDPKGRALPFPSIDASDGVVGYSADTVSVRNGAYIETYDADGRLFSQSPAEPSDQLRVLERSADPTAPPEGQAVIWQSDGTGTGEDGDILVSVTAAGATKTKALLGQLGVVVTDAATYAVLAANSGKVHIVPDLTANCVISLPTAAAGLSYEFWYGGVAADAHNWTLNTGSDTNFFLGGVVQVNDDDSNVRQAPDGDSNSKMNVLTPDVGTVVKLYCNGTNWYLSGTVASATADAVTWADQ